MLSCFPSHHHVNAVFYVVPNSNYHLTKSVPSVPECVYVVLGFLEINVESGAAEGTRPQIPTQAVCPTEATRVPSRVRMSQDSCPLAFLNGCTSCYSAD
jgi:hypothetical protein